MDIYDNRTFSVAVGQNGIVWFGTPSGSYEYNGVNWSRITQDDGIYGYIIDAIDVGSSGDLWIVSRYRVG